MNSSVIFDIGPPASDKAARSAWLKENPDGPRRLVLPSVDCVEWIARGRGRYVSELPAGSKQ
jgi:hypothetical protein